MRVRARPESWLFPDLPNLDDFVTQSPSRLDPEERTGWARQRLSEELARRYGRLGAGLSPGITMSAELADGEIRFLIDGMAVVDRIFVDDVEGPFIVAQWKVLAASTSITASTTGRIFARRLRRLAVAEDNSAAVTQIMGLGSELEAIEAGIAESEAEMNELLYGLYDIDFEDIRRIEAG